MHYVFSSASRRRFLMTLGATALGTTALSAASLVPTTTYAADFSGERIEWIIPFKEGGGSDTWARFYAPFLSQHLPGNPVVAVKNVPGGGSITGSNQFASRARPNGLSILGTSGSTQFPYLLGDKRVRYDYKDWVAVLASPTGGVVYLKPELGVQSAADLGKIKDLELVFGSQGATSLDLIPLLAFEGMGLNVKAVFGMKGRGSGRLAFERGETTIDYQTSSAYLESVTPLVEAGEAVPIMSWGTLDDDGNLVRDPTFPDLPHFAEAYEMMTGEQPAGAWFDAWKAFFAAGFAAQKMILLPKDTPEDVVEAWRNAAIAAVASDELQAKKQEVLGDYKQATGNAAQKAKQIATDVDSAAREWVANWLQEKYNAKL